MGLSVFCVYTCIKGVSICSSWTSIVCVVCDYYVHLPIENDVFCVVQYGSKTWTWCWRIYFLLSFVGVFRLSIWLIFNFHTIPKVHMTLFGIYSTPQYIQLTFPFRHLWRQQDFTIYNAIIMLNNYFTTVVVLKIPIPHIDSRNTPTKESKK
jgi:hypothetical protein